LSACGQQLQNVINLIADETDLKQSWNQVAWTQACPSLSKGVQEIAMRKMIEVGSKEEVELLLALFGSRSEPAKKKPRSRWRR
jgi:hypothetical protein